MTSRGITHMHRFVCESYVNSEEQGETQRQSNLQKPSQKGSIFRAGAVVEDFHALWLKT